MSDRKQVTTWILEGHIPIEKSQEALEVANSTPSVQEWGHFLQRIFLWSGAIGLTTAIGFFIAFNWSFVGRFTTFASLQLSILGGLWLYWKQQEKNTISKVSLTVLSILVGITLAFFGQTYQTGADSWQLFASWTLMITPWVVTAQFSFLWLIWIALINLTCIQYESLISVSFYDRSLFHFGLNTLFAIVWETSLQKTQWSSSRWPIWILTALGGVHIQALVCNTILDTKIDPLSFGIYFCWLGGIFAVYRTKIPDLILNTIATLSVCITIITFVIELMPDWNEITYLAIGIIGLCVTSVGSLWLRRIHKVHQDHGATNES